MSMLFSPTSFKGLTLRNRIVMPPMATAFEAVSYTHLLLVLFFKFFLRSFAKLVSQQ